MPMLRAHYLLASRSLCRRYATVPGPHALVFLEHRAGVIDSGSLSALTAAQQLGGEVTGLVVGGPDEVKGVVEKAKKLKGLSTLLHSTSSQYAVPVPEIVSPLLEKLLSSGSPFTHVVSSHSSSAKSLLPRVAARLDLPAVSDITSLDHDSSDNSTTFTRPIYAGNAIATVRAPSSLPIKFFTVRSTAFAAALEQDAQVEDKSVDPVEVSNSPSQHVKTDLTKSDRPELGAASRVVSGGRALKNAETFNATLEPLADVLGAAIGASRAAVDAGKVVAPELYMAIGISGAIQHLAGMKDSKMIVAINKDPDAPIFQVADAGLVADLYDAVPELVEKLKAQ
ncbi:electron transfer flavoprotein alpha subunit [Fomitopsis serialis]|uniref:electron transfer flavoprotein alpha subunit n=1 Tax=Fomitopsis serialis TaxID=139415 RepID=UPI0020073EBE|nr:electron transfer flavoprotein alpha subunit [Neoantrodia serialis]KAH9935631.1 electron transfer flavoprotein alpha subunit [Neoantrodia serialis]